MQCWTEDACDRVNLGLRIDGSLKNVPDKVSRDRVEVNYFEPVTLFGLRF